MFRDSHLYVGAHQDEMRKAAANERLARKRTATKSRSRIGAVARSVWSLLAAPDDRPMSTPAFANYPFRG